MFAPPIGTPCLLQPMDKPIPFLETLEAGKVSLKFLPSRIIYVHKLMSINKLQSRWLMYVCIYCHTPHTPTPFLIAGIPAFASYPNMRTKGGVRISEMFRY